MSVPGNPSPGGDQNKAPILRAVLGTELTLATIIVLLRFYTRLRMTRSPGTEDWIMLATFVRSLFLESSITSIKAYMWAVVRRNGHNYGIRRHEIRHRPSHL